MSLKVQTPFPRYLRALYPFESHFFETLEGRLHYVDEGRGFPVIMLHGNPTWSFYYRNLILAIKGDFRCLAIDHLGCGLSEKPQKGIYNLKAHIERTCAWIESLNLSAFDLVLHDWGGAIGMGVLHHFKEKVQKVVLLNTAIFQTEDLPWSIRFCRLPLLGACLTQGLNLFLKGALRTCVNKALKREIADGYLWPYPTWKSRLSIYEFVRDIPVQQRHSSYNTLIKLQAMLPLLNERPCKAFWGMKDFVFTESYLRKWNQHIPSLGIKKYMEAGHWLLEDARPDVFNDIKAFLASSV